MAGNKAFASMKELLPTVLARLASESGRASGMQPLWEEVAGGAIARSATPHTLASGVLTFRVANARWKRELEESAPALLERLNARLGSQSLRALAFVVGP